MTVYFRERFDQNEDRIWTNVQSSNGLIQVKNQEKHVLGSGITNEQLGWHGIIPNSGISLSGDIVQFNVKWTPNCGFSIFTFGVSLDSAYDHTNGVSIVLRSDTDMFMLDEGGLEISGSNRLSECDLTKTYTCRFQFEAGGTVSGYVDGPGVSSHDLGESTIGNSFTTGPVYIQVNQTAGSDSSLRLNTPEGAIFDEIFYHDEGLSYDTSTFAQTTLNNLTENSAYQTIAASQTETVLGSGNKGDVIRTLEIVPATTSPGAVSIKDGLLDTATVFTGGASSVSDLTGINIPINSRSYNGGWKVTTGANVSVLAEGNF